MGSVIFVFVWNLTMFQYVLFLKVTSVVVVSVVAEEAVISNNGSSLLPAIFPG